MMTMIGSAGRLVDVTARSSADLTCMVFYRKGVRVMDHQLQMLESASDSDYGCHST
jgi:hypothetical protein